MFALSGCEQSKHVDRIKQRGELIVATLNSPSSLYEGAQGLEGLEYDLVNQFAQEEGLTARFIALNNIQGIIRAVKRGEVHMAAAGISDTLQRRKILNFSLPYQTISEKLIYRRGSKRPRSLHQIQANQLRVAAESSHIETLSSERNNHPFLDWVTEQQLSTFELLDAIDRNEIAFTIADSNDIAIAQRIFRYIKPAFTVKKDQKLSWAFPKQPDISLRLAADRFLTRVKSDGTLARLIERYYGHSHRLNFVDKRDFRRHMQNRLPKYLSYFKNAENDTGIDWRLIAAIGYQESHWRANAVSPTGVRGIMMLTQATAKQLSISNRRDPQQSIKGGARYLKNIEKKIPKRITGRDRLWLALAGYNVGFGHLEDARILTQRQGGNPDLWMDVKKHLPLLTKKNYYSTLKHGYARGHEPVNYVENIRNYYDLLVWYDQNPLALIDKK